MFKIFSTYICQNKRINSICNDRSTGSCICLKLHIYMSHVNKVQPIRVKNMDSSNTCSYILLSFFSSRSRVLHRWELYVPYPTFVYLFFIFMTLFTFFLLNAAAAEEPETHLVREARTE
jgi:hypothetical protein